MERKDTKQEPQLPQWAQELCNAYQAYELANRNMEFELGNVTCYSGQLWFGDGNINRSHVEQMRQRLTAFFSDASELIPEAIRLNPTATMQDVEYKGVPCRYVSDKDVASGSYYKGGKLVLTATAGTFYVTAYYYLPRTNERYRIMPGYNPVSRSTKPIETKYFPDSSDFVGFDFMRGKDGVPALHVFLEKIRQNQRHEQLQEHEIRILLQQVNRYIPGSSPKRKLYNQMIEEYNNLNHQRNEAHLKAAQKHAKIIKQRIGNLTTALVAKYGPDALKDPIQIMYLEGKRGLYYYPQTNELFIVPLMKKKKFLRKEAEEPDFPSAQKAPEELWCGTQLLPWNLLLVVPRDIRDRIRY